VTFQLYKFTVTLARHNMHITFQNDKQERSKSNFQFTYDCLSFLSAADVIWCQWDNLQQWQLLDIWHDVIK